MASCYEMKVGEIYTCPDCGIELEVVKACDDTKASADKCGCESEHDGGFSCCGRELELKKD